MQYISITASDFI